MADDLERRMQRIEMSFDEYIAMFYRWLDELRQDMKAHERQHEERMARMEAVQIMLVENDSKIIETQRLQAEDHGLLVRLFEKIDRNLDDHEGRLSAGGL